MEVSSNPKTSGVLRSRLSQDLGQPTTLVRCEASSPRGCPSEYNPTLPAPYTLVKPFLFDRQADLMAQNHCVKIIFCKRLRFRQEKRFLPDLHAVSAIPETFSCRSVQIASVRFQNAVARRPGNHPQSHLLHRINCEIPEDFRDFCAIAFTREVHRRCQAVSRSACELAPRRVR